MIFRAPCALVASCILLAISSEMLLFHVIFAPNNTKLSTSSIYSPFNLLHNVCPYRNAGGNVTLIFSYAHIAINHPQFIHLFCLICIVSVYDWLLLICSTFKFTIYVKSGSYSIHVYLISCCWLFSLLPPVRGTHCFPIVS